jgi:hypothetical protein
VKTTVLRCLAVTALLATMTIPLEAQRRPAARPAARAAASYRPRVGAHLGYNFDVAAGSALLGAQAAFPIAPGFDLYPSFDFYFVDAGSVWALNLDARYRPRSRFAVAYLGGGLDYIRVSSGGLSSSDTNLNLLGGLEANRARQMAPYVEARFILGNGSAFQIAGGVSFKLR